MKKEATRRSTAITVLLALAGITVLLYPVVASQWNNARQQQVAREYIAAERQIAPKLLTENYRKAQEYNLHTPDGPILDPWLARVSRSNDPYQVYLGQLNLLPEMGTLIIPAVNVKLPIYHGTTEDILRKGIGHFYGSSLPVGGKGTHAILTGHSGLSNASLLDNLHKVEVGNTFYVQVSGEKLKYEVRNIRVVKPTEVSSLKRQPDKDLVTIITCTPYGINSHRLLVTGERVPMDKAGIPPVDGLNWPWWMIAIIAVSLTALSLLLWWLWRRKKEKKKSPEESRDNECGRHRKLDTCQEVEQEE